MTIFTLFMISKNSNLYEPRTHYASYDMTLFNISDITIKPKQKVSIPLGISIQMNDNREAEQSPFMITPLPDWLQYGLVFDQNPFYVYNRANYYTPSITVINNSDKDIIIPANSPIGSLTNYSIFDLIIM